MSYCVKKSARSVIAGILFIVSSPVFTDEFVTSTTPLEFIATEALGAEYRSDFHSVVKLVEIGEFEKAIDEIQPLVAYCKKKIISDDSRYFAFSNQSEFDAYLSEHPNSSNIIWLDIVCADTFELVGFILASVRQWEDALRWLDMSIALAPYMAGPHTEKGYVYNGMKNFTEAIKEYEVALNMSSNYSASNHIKPIALRGMGFCLIELGQLDKAESVFKESLILEPENEIALSELQYIEKIRSEKQ